MVDRKRHRKRLFAPPELTVYGSISQLTKVNCPSHGIRNEPGGPFTDSPGFEPCKNQGVGSKKT